MPVSDVVVVLLKSTCSACGKVGYNYLADRHCFQMLCMTCIDQPCGCDEDFLIREDTR